MKRARAVLLLLLIGLAPVFLAACKKKGGDDYVFVPVAAHTDCVEVFDPKLAGDPEVEITYAVEPAGYTYTVDVKIMDGATLVRLLVDSQSRGGGTDYAVQWDGRNDAGQFVDPGTYQVTVDAQHDTVTPTTYQAQIDVVRLGVEEMSFGGYAMVYPKRSAGSTVDYAISTPQWAIENLDTATGASRAEAVPNDSVMYPDSAGAVNCNYPFCYASGATVQFSATLGAQTISNITQTAVGTNYPVAGRPIRIEASGYSTQDTGADDISPGGSFGFEADTALAGGCAAGIVAIDFTFSYHDGSGWVAIPGRYGTTHELYRTAGVPRAVDYDYSGSPDGFLYVPLVEWSCTWAAGASDVKSIADGCYLNLEDCGLMYMVQEWFTADMLDQGGGMCDGWNDLFDHLLAVHGFATERYFYGPSMNAGSSPELKWASIVIKSPGMNRAEPVFLDSNNYRCVDWAYPIPRYFGDYSSGDDVEYYQNQTWYKFDAPNDGHCINFLEYGGAIYLYDPTFRNTLGPNPIPGTFTALPPSNQYMQGAPLAAFKSAYYNAAIDYHRGNVYYNTGSSTSVGTLDIRTSLFGADELRLFWWNEN